MTPNRKVSFSALLGRLSVEEFVGAHWGRHPVHLRADPEMVESLIPTGGAEFFLSDVVELLKAGYAGESGAHHELAVGSRAEAEAMLSAGRTLCAGRIQRVVPNLERLCADTKLSLGTGAEVYASSYCSPPGGGFGLHFDCKHVFIVQVTGEKRWRYSSEGMIADPPCNLAVQSIERFNRQNGWSELARPREEGFTSHVLTPGDVLYLPPGTWHVARAESLSIGVTIAVSPLTSCALITEVLGEQLLANRDWRADVPLTRAHEDERGAMPDDLRLFFERRLDELRTLCSRLTPAHLHASWARKAVVRDSTVPAPVEADLHPRDRLRLVERASVRFARLALNGGPEVMVVFGPRQEVQLPLSCEALLHEIFERREFTASELLSSDPAETLDWGSLCSVLQSLGRAGVLVAAA